MELIEVREEILKCCEFASEKRMINIVIRLYIANAEDIDIWEENGYFLYSSGNQIYPELDGLLDDLMSEIENNYFDVTSVEIE